MSRSGQGWSAELALPLTSIRFRDGSQAQWRFQFRRFIARLNELDAWVLVPRSEHGELLRYRPLAGLPQLSAPLGVELRPFVLGRWRAGAVLEAGVPLDFTASVGVDARLGLTSNLSIDATVLPDFGQVEADQAQLNLSTFELHFPEKRPFFLEGADLFELKDVFGDPLTTQLFYSRRLGAPLSFDAPAGLRVAASPDVTRLWSAAKLTGHLGESWSIALLEAVSAGESATLIDAAGRTVALPLAATSNFLVARVGRVLPAGFAVAATLTDRRAFEAQGALLFQGACPSADAPGSDRRCSHDTTAAALDGTWSSPEGDWAATAALMLSARQNGPVQLLRDGTRLGPGDLGVGGRFEGSKIGGRVIADVVYETYSPQFDLNDVGFLPTQNLHRLFTQLGLHLLDVGPARDTRSTIEVFGRESWDGVLIAAGVQLNNFTVWNNFWQSWLELQWYPTTYDNRETHDGARYERPSYFGLEYSLSTNPARTVVGSVDGIFGTTWRGVHLETSASVSFRPASQWEFALSPTLVRVTGDPRWVDTFGPSDQPHEYRFGLQDALAAGATLRSNWTLSPTLSVQAYAQLFLATLRYGTLFRETASGQKSTVTLAALEDLGPDPAYDERETVLNGTLVFRWEYLPGSVLFLVYSHSQSGAPTELSATGVPRLELASVGRVPASDVVMLKLSYFFSR